MYSTKFTKNHFVKIKAIKFLYSAIDASTAM